MIWTRQPAVSESVVGDHRRLGWCLKRTRLSAMALRENATALTITRHDFTTTWACRQGDYLLWLRRAPLAGPEEPPRVLDLWSVPDGTLVTITNRWQDFPIWFDVHPLEIRDSLISWMKRRIEVHDYPDEPLDGPNIWRAKGGDRVIWVGQSRSQDPLENVLGVLDCRKAVVVLADHRDGPLALMEFNQTPTAISLCRAAMEAERTLGQIRVYDEEWRLG